MTTKDISIYAGEGISHLSCEQLLDLWPNARTIYADELKNTAWMDQTQLLVIPGGRDLPYKDALGGIGNDNIRKFVKNGGYYLGICAGAYYASSEVIFEKGTELEICEKRELQFFPDAAFGSIYGPYSYRDHTSAKAVKIRTDEETFHIYYNGGCSFRNVEKHKNVEVLAYYDDFDSPAVVQCKVGKGTALLSGVHLEFQPHVYEHLRKTLESSETQRQNFLKTSLAKIS